MKLLFTSLFLFVTMLQTSIGKTSSLTVFSQEGEKFFLIMDGIRQNDLPMTNVKVTDLDRPIYKVKVIFEDANQKDIDKNVFLEDVDGNAVDLVYNIRPNRKGVLDMRISSFNEAKVTPTPKEENVIKYHPVENPKPQQPEKTTTITTTTTTVTNPSNTQEGININMGMGTGVNTTVTEAGKNISVNMNIGGMNSNTVTTTQEVITTTTTTLPVEAETEQEIYEEVGCVNAMGGSSFTAAKSAVSKQTFSESMMKTAKQLTKANCLSVKQIKEIMQLFSFDDDMLAYAKYAYDYCINQSDYFMLTELFSFSSSADSLNDFLDQK